MSTAEERFDVARRALLGLWACGEWSYEDRLVVADALEEAGMIYDAEFLRTETRGQRAITTDTRYAFVGKSVADIEGMTVTDVPTLNDTRKVHWRMSPCMRAVRSGKRGLTSSEFQRVTCKHCLVMAKIRWNEAYEKTSEAYALYGKFATKAVVR